MAMAETYNGYRIPTARAEWWDYSLGMYHVTLCTEDALPYFGDITGEGHDAVMHLSQAGEIAENEIIKLSQRISGVEVAIHQVMPNHIHILLAVNDENIKLANVIRSLKAGTKREINSNNIPFEWQPRYYDVIAKSQKQYEVMYNYIMNNVAKWNIDEHHPINIHHRHPNVNNRRDVKRRD